MLAGLINWLMVSAQQSNAAAAEELAATSEALSEQVDSLEEAMGFFRLK